MSWAKSDILIKMSKKSVFFKLNSKIKVYNYIQTILTRYKMASQKAIQNSQRLRYIRALERFYKSINSFLSSTNELTKQKYDKKINNALKLLNRVEEVQLYKGELQDLQKLVKRMIALKDIEKEMQDVKDELLYSSNQLEKTKNSRKYKKDKHTKDMYKDWE